MSSRRDPPGGRTPVLYLLDFLRPGVGVPETLRWLVDPCREAGFELHAAPLHKEKHDLRKEFAARGVPILDLHARFVSQRDRRLFRMFWYVRRHRIRLIHANEFRSIHLSLLLKRFVPSLRVLGHLRVTGNVRSKSGRRSRWLARNAPKMTELVAVSQAVLDDFRDATGLKDFGRVIFNGRPLDRFASGPEAISADERERLRRSFWLPAEGPLLVCAASLQASKDHGTLLRAAARLVEQGRKLTLLVAGEGPDRRELEQLIQELRIAEFVKLLGRREDVPQLLRCADLYVSSSLREGLPGSVIEAQASGLPCVVTRCGGPEEVVVDGETGLVVPPQDPEAFARAIATLLDHPARRARMGVAARENARRFDLAPMVAAWTQLYRDALST
jgi:glycosyltransferase involved in cell wall biosynthesis